MSSRRALERKDWSTKFKREALAWPWREVELEALLWRP